MFTYLLVLLKHLVGWEGSENSAEWKNFSEQNVKKLIKIADSINTDRKIFNDWKLIGYSTSLLGGGLAIASTCTFSITLGLSTLLAAVGVMLTVAGLLVLFGTSLFEFKSLKRHVNEAKQITNTHRNYFQGMEGRLICANDMKNALSEILEIHLVNEIIGAVQNLIDRVGSNPYTFDRLQHFQQKFKEIILQLPSDLQMPVKIILIGTVIPIIVSTVVLDIEKRFVFDFFAIIIKSFVIFFPYLDDSLQLRSFERLFGDEEIEQDLQKTIIQVTFLILGMGVDVAGIVLYYIDIKYKSESPYAKMIINATKKLREKLWAQSTGKFKGKKSTRRLITNSS